MRIQVLVATMNQNDYSLLERLNLQSDAVVVNQCGRNGKDIVNYRGYEVLWIDSDEHGLSRSRNLALKNSSGDICILCDDDEKLNTGYAEMVENAYHHILDADFIAFNVNRVGWNEKERLFNKPKAISSYRTYSSVHNTFRRVSILKKDIKFDVRFGAGSGMYPCAEDAIFCMDCHKAGLKMYTYPGVLCEVTCEKSSWFNGYDEEFFYNIGAYVAATFPRRMHFLKWYYPVRCRILSSMSAFTIISAINGGIRGYGKKLNYAQYYSGERKRANKR